MSFEVSALVRKQSRARRGARNVMWTLAEVAAHDGTVWLPIGPEDFEDSLSHGAGLGERQVMRAIQTLEDLDELEVRTWKDGRAEKNIYRLIVGPLRAKPVNYDRPELAKIELVEQFWTIDELLVPRVERPRHRTRPGPAKGTISTLRPSDTLSDGQGVGQGADQLTSPPGLTDISGADQLTQESVPRARGPFKPPLLNRHEPSEQQQDQNLKPGLPPSVASTVEPDEISEETAAASESEPWSIDRIVGEMSKLEGWDDGTLQVVGPLIYSIPADVAAAVLADTLSRRNRKNDVGYFIHLLRVKIPQWRSAQHEARLAAWDAFFGADGIERVKRDDPERYVLAWASPALAAAGPIPPNLVISHVSGYLLDYVPDPGRRIQLARYFNDEHASVDQRRTSFRSLKDAVLKMLTVRPLRDLGDVKALIEAFTSDLESRRLLKEFADELHAATLDELGAEGLQAEIDRGAQAA